MKNIAENLQSLASIVPSVLSANTDGSIVDTMGFNNLELLVSAGTIDLADADETYAVKLQEGALANLADAADIPSASVAITANDQLKTIQVLGLGTGNRKRYMRAVLTVGGTTPSIALAAIFNLGRAITEPVNTPDASV